MNLRRDGSTRRSRIELNAGESVSALMLEISTATEIVIPNCRYISPVMPGRKQTRTNIASSTAVVAITGPVTSSIDRMAALFGSSPSSISRFTFSITTIASSTTMPIARIRPKSVIRLIEYPIASSTANVPISDTGIASVGTSVDRQSCKNR